MAPLITIDVFLTSVSLSPQMRTKANISIASLQEVKHRLQAWELIERSIDTYQTILVTRKGSVTETIQCCIGKTSSKTVYSYEMTVVICSLPEGTCISRTLRLSQHISKSHWREMHQIHIQKILSRLHSSMATNKYVVRNFTIVCIRGSIQCRLYQDPNRETHIPHKDATFMLEGRVEMD